MGRAVNVLVDFNDKQILFLNGLKNETITLTKRYLKAGVYNISAIMVNNTSNQEIKDSKQITVKSKNIFNIINYDPTRYMLNSSYIIKILSGLLIGCLTSCVNNQNCQTILFDNVTRLCIQYNNTEFIPGITSNNNYGILYRK